MKTRLEQLARPVIGLARELGHFPDRVDAFLGVLGILAIKAMKSSPEDINGLLRELGRLAK